MGSCHCAGEDCNPTTDGREYTGHTSVTVSGKQCQAWVSQCPHQHSNNQDNMFPDGTINEASNYCRNPDNRDGGLWCYTTDPATPWEKCNVPACGQLGTFPPFLEQCTGNGYSKHEVWAYNGGVGYSLSEVQWYSPCLTVSRTKPAEVENIQKTLILYFGILLNSLLISSWHAVYSNISNGKPDCTVCRIIGPMFNFS